MRLLPVLLIPSCEPAYALSPLDVYIVLVSLYVLWAASTMFRMRSRIIDLENQVWNLKFRLAEKNEHKS